MMFGYVVAQSGDCCRVELIERIIYLKNIFRGPGFLLPA